MATSKKLLEVLDAFGLADSTVAPIPRGRVNKHWRVGAEGSTFVLRRYRQERSATAIEFEHAALDHAATKGWPVAPAIAAINDQRIVMVDGRSYSLFPYLAGRTVPYSNIERNRVKGGLLARFHRDMASWDPPGQRDGFGTAWELDAPVRAATDFASFNELLRLFEREHRDLARSLRSERYANLRELSGLAYGTGSAVPVHSDFFHDNLLFEGRELTGLLDFDLTRLDERIADVATSIWLDCLAPPAYNELRPEAIEAHIAGYVGENPLHGRELALILPLIRAAILELVAFRLTQWIDGKPDLPLRSIERSVTQRLPTLTRNMQALEGAIQRGAAR